MTIAVPEILVKININIPAPPGIIKANINIRAVKIKTKSSRGVVILETMLTLVVSSLRFWGGGMLSQISTCYSGKISGFQAISQTC